MIWAVFGLIELVKSAIGQPFRVKQTDLIFREQKKHSTEKRSDYLYRRFTIPCSRKLDLEVLLEEQIDHLHEKIAILLLA